MQLCITLCLHRHCPYPPNPKCNPLPITDRPPLAPPLAPLPPPKTMVWFNAVIKSPDQLRQRMAWALQQIFVISISGLTSLHDHNEFLANYNDIMVRNAFGNYRELMREVAYSPLMGMFLTFKGSKSFAISNAPADENFARELMQVKTHTGGFRCECVRVR